MKYVKLEQPFLVDFIRNCVLRQLFLTAVQYCRIMLLQGKQDTTLSANFIMHAKLSMAEIDLNTYFYKRHLRNDFG